MHNFPKSKTGAHGNSSKGKDEYSFLLVYVHGNII